MIKILVTGAAGMLGSAIIDRLKNFGSVIATDIVAGYAPVGVKWHLMDLLDKESCRNYIASEKPDVVVHCAAMVNVDECENNSHLAYSLHVESTICIADVISCWNGKLIYISTDSVFDGFKKGSYSEKDQPNPLNHYGKTKLYGEKPVLELDTGTVLRTNIFGWSRAEKMSFAEWIIKNLICGEPLSMFTDVLYTPIHVTHLAEIVERVISQNINGLFHAGGSSILSKYDFANIIADHFSFSKNAILPVSIDTFNFNAPRPKNMALSNNLLHETLLWEIPNVFDGVRLLKEQYDNDWLKKIKSRPVSGEYKFWEVV